jgi:hypothetical protein
MNANLPPHEINEELMTRWIDGHLSPAELEAVARAVAAEPMLGREMESAQKLGGLLRQHLPAGLEPPSPEFFTSRIMEEIQGVPVLRSMRPAAAGPRGWTWLRSSWFAPLASAAAVALLFLVSNGARPGSQNFDVARVYAPDPNVVANSFYSEEAGATVIDLKGLQAVPDEREIRAYDVADAEPAAPGKPQVFHAANDPERAIMVLAPDTVDGPRFRELHQPVFRLPF